MSGTSAQLAAVAQDAAALTDKTGLSVMTRPTRSPEEHRRAATIPCVVTAEAIDQEGIVRARRAGAPRVGVNIVSLETTAYEAPVTGLPLFRMEARVDVPQATGVARVRKAMEDVAIEENLDIEVRFRWSSGEGEPGPVQEGRRRRVTTSATVAQPTARPSGSVFAGDCGGLGAPPITGITSAIIAGFVLPFLGGSYVTIGGPAAGLAPVLLVRDVARQIRQSAGRWQPVLSVARWIQAGDHFGGKYRRRWRADHQSHAHCTAVRDAAAWPRSE